MTFKLDSLHRRPLSGGGFYLPDNVIEDIYSAISLANRIARLPFLTRWLFGSLKDLRIDEGAKFRLRYGVSHSWMEDIHNGRI